MDTNDDPSWADKAFELEKILEKRWIERLDKVRLDMKEHYEKQNAFLLAHMKISNAFISILHNKGVSSKFVFSQWCSISTRRTRFTNCPRNY